MANVCIFCSSSDHVADKYKEMGYRLGQMIAQAGHNLVYGGAVGGLMTTVAEGAHDAGGNVTGVLHERTNEGSAITGCYLKLQIETRNADHIKEIKQKLAESGFKVL